MLEVKFISGQAHAVLEWVCDHYCVVDDECSLEISLTLVVFAAELVLDFAFNLMSTIL